MIDISHKRATLRRAVATASVFCDAETLETIRKGKVPKGDVFEISRTAGLLAIKNTPHLLPFCHPIPVEYADISFELTSDAVVIRVEAECIFRTGIEVETMTAASISALNLYDMLKPIDAEATIGEIKVLEKSGGKGQFGNLDRQATAALILCGDAFVDGRKKSTPGDVAKEMLEWHDVDVKSYSRTGDDIDEIAAEIEANCDSGVDFVFTVGSTGLAADDVAVEAATRVTDRLVPGIAEAMRGYGLERTPYAALSRGIVGQRGKTLVLTLPGSTSGVQESIEALFPWLRHVAKGFDREG